MQRRLLQIKDVEAVVVMQTATKYQTTLGEEGIYINILELGERHLDGERSIFKVVVAVFFLVKNTQDPFSNLTAKN